MIASPRMLRRTAGLGKWELLLDAAAAIAAGVELVRIVSTGAWVSLPVLLLAGAAVVLRRRMPVPAAAAAIVASGIVLFEPAAAVPIWVLAEVVLFTLALRSPRPLVLAAGAIHAVLLYVGAVVVFDVPPYEPVALILPVWTAAVIASGLALRSNDDYVRALEEQARSAVAFRDSEVQRHVGAERLRIARDLHDSVAHTVSIISVHAGAAERFLERDPERARRSLQQVRSSARAVIDELQDILTVLRGQDAVDAAEAVPGIESLDALVATARTAGAAVTLQNSAPADADRSVSVAVYRIVQESLTNARKHGDGPIDITIEPGGDELHLVVTNPIAPDRPPGDGFGLLGMRERAASVHGTLETRPDGTRFVVTAALPLHPHQREEARA
ncbi:sensor histidine kinase [Microbacterium sp. NPDC056044]|uniref:sensor histidine kinase n=1 Tax=Microbacterium sp. NPDC056044 TaxID=3345690 RepID=UPI0035D92DAC